MSTSFRPASSKHGQWLGQTPEPEPNATPLLVDSVRSLCVVAAIAVGGASLVSKQVLAGRQRASGLTRQATGDVVDVTGSVVSTPGIVASPGLTEGYDLTAEMENTQPRRSRTIYEGGEEVDMNETSRPAGQSPNQENPYFWKMSKDKRTIDVVFPIDDDVEAKDIILRWGDDKPDPKRGPQLEMGWKYEDENGKKREKLVLDGGLLNAIRREDCMWTIEDMAGVRVVVLTLTRPSMMRFRHDPILQTKTEEERIEPQTWDALFVEERMAPQITDRVFFDLSFDGQPAERIEFGLFGNIVPTTVLNFLALVVGKYEDVDGVVKESAHCYKGTRFHSIMDTFFAAFGNPGRDLLRVEFSHEELVEYHSFFSDFRNSPRKVGVVESHWAIRWGADLGVPETGDGVPRKEGQATDGNSEEELQYIKMVLTELVEKGNGATLIFFRPEWEKGVSATGGTFPAENFTLPHAKRGVLSMDRHVDKDLQGSNVFVTFKEFPEMDKRWVVFGEVIDGFEVLDKLETFNVDPQKVLIEDCGLVGEAAEAAEA